MGAALRPVGVAGPCERCVWMPTCVTDVARFQARRGCLYNPPRFLEAAAMEDQDSDVCAVVLDAEEEDP